MVTSVSNKIESLQVLRGLAFLEIFFFHCGIPYFTGAFGVSVFFVLSGFCFAIKYYGSSLHIGGGIAKSISFSQSRIKKIYMLHLLLLFFLFAIGKFQHPSVFIIDALLLQSVIPIREIYYSFNGVAWYLSSYMIILFVFPFVVLFINKSRFNVLLMCILTYLGLIILSLWLSHINEDIAKYFAYICPLVRLFDVVFGYCMYILYCQLDKTKVKMLVCMISAFIISFFAVLIHYNTDIPIGIRYNYVFTIPACLWVVSFALASQYLQKKVIFRLFVFIGNYSALMFLIHQVSIGYCKKIVNHFLEGNITTQIVSCLFAFCITLGLAILYKYLERRFYTYYAH